MSMAGTSPIVRVRIPQYVLDRIQRDIGNGDASSQSDWIMQSIMYKMFMTDIKRDVVVAFDKILESRIYSPQYEAFMREILTNIVTDRFLNSPSPQE